MRFSISLGADQRPFSPQWQQKESTPSKEKNGTRVSLASLLQGMQPQFGRFGSCSLCLLAFCWIFTIVSAEAIAAEGFHAGAFAQNIDPKSFPVWVNGGIAGYQVDRVQDSLYARCLVMSEGNQRVAIAIVDNCVLPHEIVDQAKQKIEQSLGIPPSNVLIAATHTHSAVSVMGAHGCPIQQDYADALPGWIANGVQEANLRLQPAQFGMTSVVADRFVYCRDWIMKPGTANSSPFTGRNNDQVSMNPGHDNPNKLAPVGPVDHLIPILSIQTRDQKPIAVLASFSTHYAGAKALSSDYFGVVCKKLAEQQSTDAPSPFVGLMANATSGNANCIDFSKPNTPFTYEEVGEYVAERIVSGLRDVTYTQSGGLDIAFESIPIDVRMPSSREVAEAKEWLAANLKDRLPKTMIENYARETVLMSEMPSTRMMNLQVIRLGGLAIAANPCESYGETGLKIRQLSRFPWTLNIGLANGHCGYIPPPEMYQLGGYTTWRCRTSCLHEQAEPKMVERFGELLQQLYSRLPAANIAPPNQQSATDPSVIPPSPIRPKSPVAPKDALTQFVLEPGFEIQLVASEPQIVDPIAMQIDEHHRIWVVEMRDYPTIQGTPHCRIVVLKDNDSDGFYEDSTLFADSLPFATGLQPWKNGAIVTVEGELRYLVDSDGDLRADRSETWLEGFSIGNPQLRANHPTITPDGWLTIASGLRGGKVIGTKDGPFADKTADLTNADLRIHLVTGSLEAATGPSQYGMTFGPTGKRFGCSNRQPCFEVLADRRDIDKSPLAGLTRPWQNILPSEGTSKVYPLVQAWTTSNLHSGQFTAACGVCVTDSPLFQSVNVTKGSVTENDNSQSPSAMNARWTVLTCEPTGSLVQRQELVSENGTSIVQPNPSHSQGREWLASHDPWFRPVDLLEGPNGAIFVVDMYRAVIEHPEWVPPELRSRPDARHGENHGRIYRIVRSNRPNQPVRTNITSANSIESLSSSDAWIRRTASRLVLQQWTSTADRPAFAEAIRDKLVAAISSDNSSTAWHCAALLQSHSLFCLDDWRRLMQSSNPDIRSLGYRMAENSLHQESDIPTILRSLKSDHLNEAIEAAWYLARCSTANDDKGKTNKSDHLPSYPPWTTHLIQALDNHRDNGILWMAVGSIVRSNPEFLLSALITPSASPQNRFARTESYSDESLVTRCNAMERLASYWAASIDSKQRMYMLENGLEAIKIIQETWSNHDTLSEREKSMLDGRCCDVLSTLTGILREDQLSWRGCEILPSLLRPILATKSHSKTVRRIAIRLLGVIGSVSPNQVETTLMPLLSDADEETTLAIIESLTRLESASFTTWMLDQFPTCRPSLRVALFHAMRSKPDRLRAFLDRCESKVISIRLLDASQMQWLRTSSDRTNRDQALRLVESEVNPNRESLVQHYSKAIAGKSAGQDPEIGKALFQKNCSSCHQLNGIGFRVGPDISDSREQSFEKLLISVLDPNRAIDANYFRTIALTNDDQTIEGVLKDVNAQTITIEGQNGVSQTLLKSDLQQWKSSSVSMMPEGLEANLPPNDMAELLWYIKNWRYVAEGIPAVATIP